MRAIKGKGNNLRFISNPETSFFNKLNLEGFISVNTLNEREVYIAEEMYKKDVIRKVRKGETIGYKAYSQQEKI
ncbi:hypothetical protein N9N08_01195 [bacterium]|jgi:hypothetical protein|nr:hypothetical protein [bacterium]|tara:strand:- start:64 stop:285 length:222 start_codon:yes stop_codon:yes gene_type:complete